MGGKQPPLGEPAPEFVLSTNTGDGEISLANYRGQWVVLYFYPQDFTSGCTIVADTDGAVSKAYGSWLGAMSLRHTYLIDPQGVLRETFLGVRPSIHSQEVLARLDELAGELAS